MRLSVPHAVPIPESRYSCPGRNSGDKMNTQSQDHRCFLGVDLKRWVYGTVEKHQQGEDWNAA